MNTLEKPKEDLDILKFRQYQYNLIPRMLEIFFNYMEKFGLKYDKDKLQYEVVDNNSYQHPYHFSSKIIKIKFNKKNKDYFLNISIPKLIEGNFFRLKGVLYTPSFYIVDSPITLKKNSIKLYSLFQPITVYSKDNRVIFLGNNIPLSRFLSLYFDEEENKRIVNEVLESKFTNESFDESLGHLANTFNVEKDIDKVKKVIDDLFLDEWTEDLYRKFYGFENPNMGDILKKTFNMIEYGEYYEFNDLNHKRLVFVEYLMAPLFNETANAVKMLLNGEKVEKLNLNLESITKHFYSELDSNSYYSTCNGFSAILNLKASFKNPKGSGILPTSVSNVHPSFFGRICPVTVSNKEPGTVASLVPNQKLDLDYGIFN